MRKFLCWLMGHEYVDVNGVYDVKGVKYLIANNKVFCKHCGKEKP